MSEETIFAKLSIPFDPSDLEWRAGATNPDKTKALALAYITSRAVMDRLDQVVGPENWKDEYAPGPDGGVMCGLSLRIQNEWITKFDGAPNTDFEAVKGGLSDSFKRAAVKWGIGRYLYWLENVWVPCEIQGKSIVLKSLPALPDFALPPNAWVPEKFNPDREALLLQKLGFDASLPTSANPMVEEKMGTSNPNPFVPAKQNGNGRTIAWNASVVKAIISSGLAESPASAVKMLNQSELPKDATPEAAVAWAKANRQN